MTTEPVKPFDLAALMNDLPLIAEARRLRDEVRDYQAMRLSDGADLARLHAQRDAVLALHVVQRYTVNDFGADDDEPLFMRCHHDRKPWPCPTARALGGDPVNSSMPDAPKVTRLSVNLAPTVAHALRSTASRRGLSITEAVRHAIAVWKLVTDEQDKGNRVLIKSGNTYREIVIL